jgi:bifunctional non-homologous end joining protein LigD
MNWIAPMEPISCSKVKDDPEYIHEIKWDGIRGLVYLQNKELRIYTKKGNERTEFYPEVRKINEVIQADNIVLDGEMVVLDDKGFPSFHNALVRETVKSQRNLQYYLRNYPVRFMVFDVLQYNSRLLTDLPIHERKTILTELLSPAVKDCDTISISEVYTDGNLLYQKMKQNNMEGIVSKKINSTYISGKKHDAWYKTKFTKKMLCIIGGIQWKDDKPNSLIMGVRTAESENLIYMGKASLGLKEADLRLIREYKDQLLQDKCPFEASSISNIEITGSGLTWVNPVITCWVNFLELSNDGHFRHPKIIGFTVLPAEEANGRVLTD